MSILSTLQLNSSMSFTKSVQPRQYIFRDSVSDFGKLTEPLSNTASTSSVVSENTTREEPSDQMTTDAKRAGARALLPPSRSRCCFSPADAQRGRGPLVTSVPDSILLPVWRIYIEAERRLVRCVYGQTCAASRMRLKCVRYVCSKCTVRQS